MINIASSGKNEGEEIRKYNTGSSPNKHRKRFHPKQMSSEKKTFEKWEVSQGFPPHEAGTVKCDECGKSFTKKSSLVFHKKIIHQGQRLQCNVPGCEKTFSGYHHREAHMRKEHGSPMLRCKFEGCTSEFHSSDGLRRHHAREHREHCGERLQCKVPGCEKTFSGYKTREDHMRKEHGSPMLMCKFEECTSEFYSKDGLRRHHVRKHTRG